MRFVLSSCYFLGFPLTNRLPIEVPSNCLLKHSRYMKRKQKATYWIYWAFTSKTMNNDTLYPAQTQCNCESWKLKNRSHKEWWRYLQFPFLFTSFLGSPTTCSSSVLVWFPRPDDSTPHFCLLLPWKLTFVCSRKIAAWKTWKKTVPFFKGSLRVNFRGGSRILVLVFPKIRATLPIPHEKIGTWMLQTSGGTSTRVMHHLYGI